MVRALAVWVAVTVMSGGGGPRREALVAAASVSVVWAPGAGLGVNVAVTPAGRPEAANVMAPVEPLILPMLIVSEALPPWPSSTALLAGAMEKSGGSPV